MTTAPLRCFLCDQPLKAGHAKWLEYGSNKKLGHDRCDRDALVARARELGLLADAWPGQRPENHSDQVIIDAIAAEVLSGEWLERLDRLPTDEAKRDAVRRLRLSFETEETS